MKTKKKIVSLLLAAAMVITVFSGMTFAADTADIDGARQAITAGMLDWQETIDISSYGITDSDLTTYIWPEVVTRNPKLFYVWDMTYSGSTVTGKLTYVNVKYSSAYTKDSVKEYEAAVDKAFNEVIRTEMSDMQKALALHDYLVQHMEYDMDGVNAGTEKRNAYEALVNGIGVCEGYVLAYAALCEKAGIEVDYCESRALNHIWNYVKIDGNWYHVDVTWDDTSTDREAKTSHKHFLCSTDKFSSDGVHTSWDSNVSCTDKSFDNMYWQAENVSAIFAVNNKEYFIRELKNDQGYYLGGIDLVERAGTSEKVIKHYDTVWALNNGTMYISAPMISLSYYGGSLYFHTADSVYAYNPETDREPQKIYTYEGNDGVIGASFACDNEVRLVIDKANYQTDKVTVPLEVKADKQEQVIQFAETEVSRYKGDIPFTNALTHTKGDGTITYKSSNPQVATVDANGKVTVVGAGNTIISATASETNDYLPASASYKLTVKENPITILPPSLNGRVIVSKDVEAGHKDALNAAADGSFKAQFTGKTRFEADIQLIDTSNGQQVHNEEITFTIEYPLSSGITAGNYTKYDFAVLHRSENGNIGIVDFVPTAQGLKITSTLSPFIVGYSLKQTETTEQETTAPDTTQPDTTASGTAPQPTQPETTPQPTQPGTTVQPTQPGTSGSEDNNGPGGSDGSDNSDDSDNSDNGQQETAASSGAGGSQMSGSGNGINGVQPGAGTQATAASAKDDSAVSPQTGDGGNSAGRLILFIFVCMGAFGIAVCGIKKKYNK